jgi:hypothetical protein
MWANTTGTCMIVFRVHDTHMPCNAWDFRGAHSLYEWYANIHNYKLDNNMVGECPSLLNAALARRVWDLVPSPH